MASNNTLSDADLKSRLAHFGIVCPISNSTRQVLLKKLHKLEMDSHKPFSQSIENELDENMDTTMNGMDEYEIRDGISKLGYKEIPLTDSTRPLLSKIIKKNISK